jgi:type III restriction enzyme
MQQFQSSLFEGRRYKNKVIQVDSSKTGAEEDDMVQKPYWLSKARRSRPRS